MIWRSLQTCGKKGTSLIGVVTEHASSSICRWTVLICEIEIVVLTFLRGWRYCTYNRSLGLFPFTMTWTGSFSPKVLKQLTRFSRLSFMLHYHYYYIITIIIILLYFSMALFFFNALAETVKEIFPPFI